MKWRSLDDNPLFWTKNNRKVEGWYLLLRGRSLKQGQKKSCGVCCGQWGLSGMFDSLSHPLWHHNTSSTFTFHVFSFMVLSAGECGGYFWKPLKGKRSTLNPISVTTHALKQTMMNNDIRCISCKQYINSSFISLLAPPGALVFIMGYYIHTYKPTLSDFSNLEQSCLYTFIIHFHFHSVFYI